MDHPFATRQMNRRTRPTNSRMVHVPRFELPNCPVRGHVPGCAYATLLRSVLMISNLSRVVEIVKRVVPLMRRGQVDALSARVDSTHLFNVDSKRSRGCKHKSLHKLRSM